MAGTVYLRIDCREGLVRRYGWFRVDRLCPVGIVILLILVIVCKFWSLGVPGSQKGCLVEFDVSSTFCGVLGSRSLDFRVQV